MFRTFGILALALVAMTVSASAEEGAPRGLWEAPCDAWGTPAICRSEWSEGMHGTHTVQAYSISHAETGDVLFAGRGVYAIAGTSITGFWEDTQGAVHPLQGTWVGGTVQVIWGAPETEVGRSTYAFSDNELSVVDEVQAEEGWRTFMTVSYGAAQ